ncbi:MAG: hypothetical protein C4291_07505 [Candidatus Dadabacteria bacterium]
MVATPDPEVEFINPSRVLMEKQLDGIGSEILFYEIKKRGISVKIGAEVESVLGDGRARGVQLANGEVREGDLILIEARLRANVELAFQAGIFVNKGIVVNERLETSIPGIYAVGSAAEFRGIVSNDSETVAQQSQILGRFLAGDSTVQYCGTLSCTRFRVLGLEVISFGEFNSDDEESNVLSYLDRGQSVYKKVIVRDNRIVGALFLGDISSSEEILGLARNRIDISLIRKNLLSGNLKGQMPKGKILCSCMGVTREEIQARIKRGMRTVEALQEGLRVGVTCGTCLQEVRDLIKAAVK